MVTLQGVCRTVPAKGAPCRTVITRGDLDGFAAASEPDASGAARGRLAVQYARTVAFAALAERQGLDKDPALAKELEIARMRVLAGA